MSFGSLNTKIIGLLIALSLLVSNLQANLTYENLSNIIYTKGSSLSLSANYAIKNNSQTDKGNQASSQANQDQLATAQTNNAGQDNTDPNSKISSASYTNNRFLSYTHSKTLATIGQGNLVVANTDISNLSKDEIEQAQSDKTNPLSNSDDLARLNRDAKKTSKELYNTNLSSSVEASVDMRLFSDHKSIEDDYNKATAITKALSTIIQTGELNFNQEVGENYNTYEVSKIAGKELIDKLMNKEASIEEKQEITNNIIKTLADKTGLNLDNATINIINDKNAAGAGKDKFKGNFNNGIITLNLAHITDINDFIKTLGHELKHAVDYSLNNFKPQDETQNKYADIKGENFSDYLNKALSYNNINIDTKNANITYDKTSPFNQDTLNSNSIMFESMDKSKGDNNPAAVVQRLSPYIQPLTKSIIATFGFNKLKENNEKSEVPPVPEWYNNQIRQIPDQKQNIQDDVLITPQIDNQPISNGGVTIDTELNKPYVGGVQGQEQTVGAYYANQSAKDAKKISSNKEANDLAKKLGYKDAHEFKKRICW